MIMKLGIITSGGDAPGMNAAIRAVVNSATKNGIDCYGIYDGYRGIIERRMVPLDPTFVSGIETRGGTILGTVRYPEFKLLETRKEAARILQQMGIQALVCIGGDGTYRGAIGLTKLGINCVGIPGTIDNDIASTDQTLGFDTAFNSIIWCLDHLRDTSSSHHRCTVVEIMGNKCGDLTMYAGVACGADAIITKDHLMTEEDVCRMLNKLRGLGKKQTMVLVSEKLESINVHSLAAAIDQHTRYEAKAEVLGRIQRGGSPTGYDRLFGALLGAYAVDALMKGKGGIAVCLDGDKLIDRPIDEALSMTRPEKFNLSEMAEMLKSY